jgi:hypothetical protein
MNWYYRLTLNRMTRLEGKFKEILARRHPLSVKRELEKKYEHFKVLHGEFQFIAFMRIFAGIFVYASIISILAPQFFFVDLVLERITFFSGFIGLPVFTAILFFLTKAADALMMDALVLVSEVIALSTLHRRK